MTALYQMNMFKDKDDILLDEIRSIKETSDKVRKGLFARHNELAKMYIELRNEMDSIKLGIRRETYGKV